MAGGPHLRRVSLAPAIKCWQKRKREMGHSLIILGQPVRRLHHKQITDTNPNSCNNDRLIGAGPSVSVRGTGTRSCPKSISELFDNRKPFISKTLPARPPRLHDSKDRGLGRGGTTVPTSDGIQGRVRGQGARATLAHVHTLAHQQAAVYAQDVAGDVACFLGG